MSDRIVSYLRTAVPVIWGTLVAQLLAALAPHLPGDVYTAFADLLSSQMAQGLATAVVIAVWYMLWRKLEPYVPDWLTRLVLGSAASPLYIRTGEVAAVAPVGSVIHVDDARGRPGPVTDLRGGPVHIEHDEDGRPYLVPDDPAGK